MKILYKDLSKNLHLQEANLAECDAQHERSGNSNRSAYRIMNRSTDYVTERLHKLADAFAGVLIDRNWKSGYLQACFDCNDNDKDVEFQQTISFGDEIYLGQRARDAFWVAVKQAFKRDDGIFDVDEWYEKYKAEEEIQRAKCGL